MTTRGEDLSAAIAALWARQRDEMLRRVDAVDAGLAALRDDTGDGEQVAEAQRAAHKIAGAAGSFGFAAASEHARAIELALRDGAAAADAGELIALAACIRAEFGEEPSVGHDAPVHEGEPLDVLIVGGAQLHAGELEEQLAERGLRATTAADGDLARRAAVAVVDLTAPLADRFMQLAGAEGERVVVGIAPGADLDARVAFTRRGGRTLLPADVSTAEVADAILSVREALHEAGTRVLVVDDDPALLDLTTTILRGSGLEVIALDDPGRFWQTLEARNPDVLLLDLEMPGFNGLELCRAVRSDPRWNQLPVLFLTARSDPEAVREVFEAGADDYMTKPVAEEELLQRIRNRLERIRLLRDLADRDALTGVANRRKAGDELARLERIARRYGQPLTLAIIDLDRFKRINDSYGHDTGDEVLRRLGRRLAGEFRGEDVVGRWGGEEFVIGMYGMPGELAVDRLERLLTDWRRERFEDPKGGWFDTSFTAGLAELPGTAESLAGLQQAADDALYRGKAAGRCRVQHAARAGEQTQIEQVDIAIVEDDATLVELLLHALGREGWTVKVLADGPEAVDALAGDPPRVSARLVLLDWELPGLDGLAVLGRLGDAGALGRTRVVMLTARADDSEVLRALEHGAADHISKPFSLPVLVEKVRQALGAR